MVKMLVFDSLNADRVFVSLRKGRIDDFFLDLLEFGEKFNIEENILKAYFSYKLILSENLFAKLSIKKEISEGSLFECANQDIIFIFNLVEKYEDSLPSFIKNYCPTGCFKEKNQTVKDYIVKLANIKFHRLYTMELSKFYHKFGYGKFALHTAFSYDGDFKVIENIDDISFSDLYNINYQKNIIIENTKDFLCGKFAHNILLVGDSGTGKSSCVKAALNGFSHENLRLIEVNKSNIFKLASLFEILKDYPNKFIIFLDDISFEKGDDSYKELKSIIDGKILKKPDNVLVYATSNRRHLINEKWSDRMDDDVFKSDSLNENISLSQRFGIILFFESFTQEKYLDIVKNILSAKNIEFTEEIKQQALRWALKYNGRSGRTARQFANFIIKSVN